LKRKILFFILAAVITASAFAQGTGKINRPVTDKITVSGNLIVARGSPALVSGDVTYLIGGLRRLFGFVDGLKEGAEVSIEGVAMSSQKEDKTKLLIPSKLTLGGKTYEMAPMPEKFRNKNPGERGQRNRQHGHYL